ncbi:hypothetical protein D9M71_711180 [compost metagenome]
MAGAVHQNAGDIDTGGGLVDLERDRKAMSLHDRLKRPIDVVQGGVGVVGVRIQCVFQHCRDLALHLRHRCVERLLGSIGLHSLMHRQ